MSTEPSISDWLIVLSEDNWDICVRQRLIALGHRKERKLAQFAEGDRLWVYVNRKYVDRQVPRIQCLRALARITGPIRRLSTSPWKPRGEERFDVARPITVERQCDLPAVELLKQLSFADAADFLTKLDGAAIVTRRHRLPLRIEATVQRSSKSSLRSGYPFTEAEQSGAPSHHGPTHHGL